MIVAIIGTGNVGWALVENLSKVDQIKEILVSSRSEDRVTALIMDVASANPQSAKKLRWSNLSDMGVADIIVLTSGTTMKQGETAKDVSKENHRITVETLSEMKLKASAIIIALATPVDDITVLAQSVTKLPHKQVLGFGGDLDRNRLEFVLTQHKLEPVNDIHIVGEHGGKTIPVYTPDLEYEAVAMATRGYLAKTTTLAGQPKNLATAILLTKLIESILIDANRLHYVCAYHPKYKVYLTWPCHISRDGVGEPKEIDLPETSQKDLEILLAIRRAKPQYS